jgi:hypothetical protein
MAQPLTRLLPCTPGRRFQSRQAGQRSPRAHSRGRVGSQGPGGCRQMCHIERDLAGTLELPPSGRRILTTIHTTITTTTTTRFEISPLPLGLAMGTGNMLGTSPIGNEGSSLLCLPLWGHNNDLQTDTTPGHLV